MNRESVTTRSLRRFVEEQYGLAAIHTGRSAVALEKVPSRVDSCGVVQRQAMAGVENVDEGHGTIDGQDEDSGVRRKRKWSISSSICKVFRLVGQGNDCGGDLKRTLSAKGRDLGRSLRKVLQKSTRLRCEDL